MNYVHFALGKTVKSTINLIHCVRVYIAMKHFEAFMDENREFFDDDAE